MKMKMKGFIFLCIWTVIHGQIYDCPSDWITFYQAQKCYKMIVNPEATAEEAVTQCNVIANGANLLAVNNPDEHYFINSMLMERDSLRHTWITSGMKDPSSSTNFTWQGDNSRLTSDMMIYFKTRDSSNGRDRIAYRYDAGSLQYSWVLVRSNEKLSYICEISQRDAYKITTKKRDFYFGLAPSDFETVKYGPRFVVEPEDVMMVAATTALFIECQAVAYPLPTYRWYKGTNFQEEITTATDSRYTLTNGRLTIQNPNDKDEDDYRCEAENEFGKIISSPVRISMGYLDPFSNVEVNDIETPAFEGAAISINVPNHKPSVVYNWQRKRPNDYRPSFIFTETTPYIFISANGNLYFSEVTKVDEAEYYCQVTLSGVQGNAVGSSQPPSSMSLPVQLNIINNAAKGSNWGPEIQNDFIAVYPSPPLVGSNVRFECFAYGPANDYLVNWKYSWSKINGHLPDNRVQFLDLNRVMIIENAEPEDEGVYECEVFVKANSRKRQYTLTLEAKPYFLLGLEDKHLDIGEQTSWTCIAGGKPTPTYSWYKNGQPLSSDSDITINGNVLTINSANINRAPGMYQCGAENIHGLSLSSAQIRVLSFAPNFYKYPLPESIDGALNGNITIPCEPEGAPRPEIKWRKNNVDLGLIPGGGSNNRLQMLPNNHLQISQLNLGDAGIYECVATNALGSMSSFTNVKVRTGITIFMRPDPVRAIVIKQNQTALIPCQASYDPALDLVYVWKFNGRIINVDNDPFYEKTKVYNAYGLYVKMAQFKHAGVYECVARSPLNQASASGRLEVEGSPGEPVGLHAKPSSATQTTVQLQWFDGATHGSKPISYYIVECELSVEKDIWFSPRTKTIYSGQAETTPQGMKQYVVQGLDPGNGYRFRLRAVNQEGVGPPSLPTSLVQTLPAPPMYAPQSITGGNGTVGMLQMKWDALPRKYHGGEHFGYLVFWRLYKDAINSNEELWMMRNITDSSVNELQVMVGNDNYYRLYEVRIQPYNEAGTGPNSTIYRIYSAMGMPAGAPEKLESWGYNSTALEVTWIKVPNTREAMKGVVWGYQVNYWLREDPSEFPYKRSIRFLGDVNHGIVIGLQPDTYYRVEAQVFNGAGLGPLSDSYLAETFNPAPGLYPEKLEVYSNGGDSVILSWRGVSTDQSEDTLKGYKIYVWQANENYRSAKEYDHGKHPTEYTLTGIEKNFVYAARVAGYSGGGIGKKSPTVYFTLYGGLIRVDRTVTSLVQSSATTLNFSLLVFVSTVFVCILRNLHVEML